MAKLIGEDIARALQMIDNPPVNFNVLKTWKAESTNTNLTNCIQARIDYLEDRPIDLSVDLIGELQKDYAETMGITDQD